MTPAQLSAALLLQLGVILAVSRAVGWIGRRWLGQPQVVGEMVAGVLLGPSLFGLIAPGVQASLFPAASRPTLYACAQLGVGLYMFVVGLGFRADGFRVQARSAAAVSVSGIVAPFLAALLIAPALMRLPGLFAPSVGAVQATLFLGACIAITAFPMLARIIHERGLSGTPVGTLSLAAGAMDDAAAWIVLAIVLATLDGDAAGLWRTAGGAALFALVVLGAGPRLLAPFGRRAERLGGVDQAALGIALALFLVAAFAMDAIGMHAVFGGFLLGVAMPRGRFADDLIRQLEPVTTVLLLPIFFVFSGLNTQLSLIVDPALIGITLVVLVASVVAKGGACWAAARLSGQDNATALGVGALMNARGLMELIIINLGLQRGVIGPALFAILVLMAIVTTLIAAPLFERIDRRHGRVGRTTS